MACYFGCGTGKNRLAWCFYTTFLLISIGCWIGFGFNASKCAIDSAGPDGPCAVLSGRSLSSNADIDITARSVQEAAGEVCTQEYGFRKGTQDYDDCVECLMTVSKCVVSRSWIFIAAIVFGMLSFIPCIFFCCCATNGQKKYGAQI